MKYKIILTGSTGLIGFKLGSKLADEGNEITLFTRNITPVRETIQWASNILEWDYTKPNLWQNYIEGKDAVIHLAGANLGGKRWNNHYKKIIYDSRITSTKNIVNVINACNEKPKVFITASAVGIYGNRCDELISENSTYGNDFLANLCKDWEKEAEKVESSFVRRVSLRLGIVLSKKSGMLKELLLPFKLFAGGPLGNGKQWVPWLHIRDAVDIIEFALSNNSLSGAVNCGAPGIVRMKDFAKILGKIIHRPSYLHIPKFILRIVAGEIANTAVSSQRISIGKLMESGYQFKHPYLEDALKDLLNKD